MTVRARLLLVPVLLACWTLLGPSAALRADQDRPVGQTFSFRTAVELVNVTATVTDASGRFVSNLRREDFTVYEDGKPQEVSQFEAERVPVSLGIALDTSGSMLGEKLVAAQAALNRFLVDLLGPQDEVFIYRFDSRPTLIQTWTGDRAGAGRTVGVLKANGGTAIYDTVAEAVPLAQAGSRRKKALVVITDGNDTSSSKKLNDIKQVLRETEVLIYAIGIDASDTSTKSSAPAATSQTGGPQIGPAPFPGKRPVVSTPAPKPAARSSGRVNVEALRQITDDSGGRTDIIVSHRDLDPVTAGIADELSRQYFIGYVSSVPKDGRWHTIEVRVRQGGYTVRARKGFIAN